MKSCTYESALGNRVSAPTSSYLIQKFNPTDDRFLAYENEKRQGAKQIELEKHTYESTLGKRVSATTSCYPRHESNLTDDERIWVLTQGEVYFYIFVA